MPPSPPAAEAHHALGMAATPEERQRQELLPDRSAPPDKTSNDDRGTDLDDDGDSDSDEEAEPHFKYSKLTSHLANVYRNGDSTSACLLSADKLIIGTHSGNVHVLSLPSLRTLRVYRAHSASITCISVSPFSPVYSPVSNSARDGEEATRTTSAQRSTPVKGAKYAVPPTTSNTIHIATSSIDGHVCVSSLVDPNDVVLRNFKRPVQCVALSPEYKYDRAYLSGGLAGNLVLTTGGRAGVSADANTTGAAAAASGWLGQIGLGTNTGKDAIVHSGEGGISAIAWSLSGKYVAWVNEQGIKVARTNLFLSPDYASSAWTRIGHIDRPNRRLWEDMAGVWKAKAHWIDRKHLDSFQSSVRDPPETTVKDEAPQTPSKSAGTPRKQAKQTEQLIVGWGDSVWIVDVDPKGKTPNKSAQAPALGSIVPQHLKLDDGILAGLSLFTPKSLLALTHQTQSDDGKSQDSASSKSSPAGIRKRQNGLPSEMHLISLESDREELEVESLKVSRFQSLSAVDYHLCSLFFSEPSKTSVKQRNAFGQFSDGLWDVGMNATKLFSSGASVLSGSSGDDRTSASTIQEPARNVPEVPEALASAFSKPGVKTFVISPFDLLVGMKRDMTDRLGWLIEQEKYQEAWELLEKYPGVVPHEAVMDSRPSTPTRGNASLMDFFADDRSMASDSATTQQSHQAAVKRKKRQIGDLWIQQLVSQGQWGKAAQVAEDALDISSRWEHWISTFVTAGRIDEISGHMPVRRLMPPISTAFYELILGHYVKENPDRLKQLINSWDATLYDEKTVTSAIEMNLAALEDKGLDAQTADREKSWRLLQSCLGDLSLADGRDFEAIRCYIKAKAADPAMQLVREHGLFTALEDQVYPFVTIQISPEELASAPQAKIDELSADPIFLLASAAAQGQIPVSETVRQLQRKDPSSDLFLHCYFRTLWNGDVDKQTEAGQPKKTTRRSRFAPLLPTNTTRVLLTSFADLTVSLFAKFDPSLLNEVIRANDASADADMSGGSLPYSFEHASAVCKAHGLISELVYLLAVTGQTREALHIIVDDMKDVRRAITFAREMDDRALWTDLLEYSLDKPAFIKGLLEEVGGGIGEDEDSETTAIDPLSLVKRIPEELEIEGLKGGLARILKDGEIQTSISEGAAKVLRAEVALLIDTLTKGRAKGILFDVPPDQDRVGDLSSQPIPHVKETTDANGDSNGPSSGQHLCSACNATHSVPVGELLVKPDSQDFVIGFACGHIFHLTCLLDRPGLLDQERDAHDLRKKLDESIAVDKKDDTSWTRGKVGAKITRTRFVRGALGKSFCGICEDAGGSISINET